YIGFALKSLLVGVGKTHPSPLPLPGREYRRKPTPRPSPSQEGKTEEIGMSEEVGVRIVNLGFFYHSQPKILAFCSSWHRKAGTFLNPKKANTLYLSIL
ncbi:hypothetical protein, partial [Okeania sp. SIO1H2]|uniref:hypothetical protein n=1 Tax=Okeania sp. SIO1H2 TaxID=2607775 RepID=UPI00141C7A71